MYQLREEEPFVLEENHLPVKLVAKNGFHCSKPFYISRHNAGIVLIGVGCKTDNGSLWGGIIFSGLFFAVFFATGFYAVLVLANLPLLYLVYKFFLQTKEFITIEALRK